MARDHLREHRDARRDQWAEIEERLRVIEDKADGSWWTKHSTGRPQRPVEPRSGEKPPDVA